MLKCFIKPQEHMMLNGAIVQNGGPCKLELQLQTHAKIVNTTNLIFAEDVNTPASQLYYEIMLLCGGHSEADLGRALARLADYADRTRSATVQPRCSEIENFLMTEQFYPALKIAAAFLVEEGWRPAASARKARLAADRGARKVACAAVRGRG